MIQSMTAFGRARATVGGKDISVELRSVNNRFFDCSVKLPRSFSFLEEKIKPHLQAKGVSRGKVDVFVSIDVIDTPDVQIEPDEGYAKAYLAALRSLGKTFGLQDDISIMTVAQNRDLFVIQKPQEDIERDWQDVRTVLEEALDRFLAARQREGENIKEDLCGKLAAIRQRVADIEALSLEDTQTYRQRLEARLKEMLADNRIVFEESRILTECAIFADRIAIDEELVRLASHFDALEGLFKSSEAVGRKIDFMLQETNREINTIGSKCTDVRLARIVVDIKAELEKIREQTQNIE